MRVRKHQVHQAGKGLLLALSGAFHALPSFAAEAGEKTGLPQLDTSMFPEQLFWLAITFGLLYLLMTMIALPGVKRTQDSRQATIAAELAAASQANEAAKVMIVQYEKALSEARAKAQASVSEISAQAAKTAATEQHAQQQELAKRLRDAETAIKSVRDAAMKEIKGASLELAQSIIDKVGGAMKVKA